jgi:D-aminoacyl-tRNA deacylase
LTSLIVASKLDPAAQTIAGELLSLTSFQQDSRDLFRSGEVYLRHVDTDGIHTDRVDVGVKPEIVIFASRHRSESNEPAITVHWTGNTTARAEFGGQPKTLSFTDPPRLRSALLALDSACSRAGLEYAATLEATHHGPTDLAAPTLFVEIGSTDREYRDKAAGAAAAEAIWAAATKPALGKSAVGFGGGHYCNKHCAALRQDGYAFSHIFSKYFFDSYDPAMVQMAYDRTIGGCQTAVIDWKGMRGSKRTELLSDLERMKVEIVRV